MLMDTSALDDIHTFATAEREAEELSILNKLV